MVQVKLYKTEAIVLKHIPFGEADRLVTLYTPQLGKVRAVAKGARRARSKLAGHLEPLTRVNTLIRRGKTLDTISQSETVTSNLLLRGDLWRMSSTKWRTTFGRRRVSDSWLPIPDIRR